MPRTAYHPLIHLLSFMIISTNFILSSAADPYARSPHLIYLPDEISLRELSALNLDILRTSVGDEPNVQAFLNEEEVRLLQALHYRIEKVPYLAHNMYLKLKSETEETDDPMREYHTYAEMVTELQNIATANPDICQLYNIGQTLQGRAQWFIKISDNVATEEDELEFKYISTIHGDEPVGTEMCMYLINFLVDEYGFDPELTALVNETEIWIMPMMNPDGNAMGIRYNANGVDLNRNFPDRVDDPVNTTTGREIETANVMNWNFDHQPILSANFHTGSLVANYPWDHCFDPQANHAYTDNQDWILPAAEAYSFYNTPMWNNNWGSFNNGTVNGADWYQISGGMQDWNYHWMGDMDITMEISNVSWPSSSSIPGYWEDNRQSMIEYMKFPHRGIRGIVSDALTSLPLLAEVEVVGRPDFITYTDPDVGDYHYPLMSGTYNIDFRSYGYWPAHLTNIEVFEGEPIRNDVALEAADIMTFSGILHTPSGGGLSAELILLDTPYDIVQTNINGEFNFVGIYEGEYTLRIINLDDNSVIDFPIIIHSMMDPFELWGPISIFTDGFESGLTSWSAQGTWGTSGNAHSGSLSAADSPGSNYGNNLSISLTCDNVIDLTEYDYATLSYYITFNCETNYDSLFAEVSLDGTNWEKVKYHNSRQDWWSLETGNLENYLSNPNVRMRFRLQTDGSVTRDGGFIDDVCIGVASLDPIAQALQISLTPYGTPIQIPSTGGDFDFNIAVSNSGGSAVTADVWTDVTMPGGSQYGPILGPITVNLTAGQAIDRNRNQTVPGSAPAGTYTYNAYVGEYPSLILADDSFSFEKAGEEYSEIDEWFNSGEDFYITAENTLVQPEEFILAQNYPNPFNPITAIHFALPQREHISLKIYNANGQWIATLIDGIRDSGWQEVPWDASHLATGLYLYTLTAGDFALSKKALLIK